MKVLPLKILCHWIVKCIDFWKSGDVIEVTARKPCVSASLDGIPRVLSTARQSVGSGGIGSENFDDVVACAEPNEHLQNPEKFLARGQHVLSTTSLLQTVAFTTRVICKLSNVLQKRIGEPMPNLCRLCMSVGKKRWRLGIKEITH
ncbi:MAG TPA: hypothetical protein VFO86_04850, partial [Terriglobia bacterium]|nr:hypothetical protein [Terriglobia bacterium]